MLPADGVSTLNLTVTAVDGTDAPLPNAAVNVTVTTGMGTVQPTQVTTGTDGTASVTLTAGTTGGNATVTAALASVNYNPETAPNATTTVTIVKAQFGGAWPLLVPMGSTATVAVTVTPTSAASSVAFDTVDTSVATVTGDATGLTVSGVATGTTTLRATVNGSAVDVGTVDVVKVATLSYQKPDKTWADATAQTVYAVVGSSLTFKAAPSPGTAWPDGWPQWSGAATGTGPTATVTFNTQSTSATDYKTVTVGCGTSSLTANVVVYSVTISVRRKGDVDPATGQPVSFGASATVAAGAVSSAPEHCADVQIQVSPAISNLTVGPPVITDGADGENVRASVSPTAPEATDEQGCATWNFVSSNVSPQNVAVAVGKAAASVAQTWNELGDASWNNDTYFYYGQGASIRYTMQFGSAVDITGHALSFDTKELSGVHWDATAGPIDPSTGHHEGDYVRVNYLEADTNAYEAGTSIDPVLAAMMGLITYGPTTSSGGVYSTTATVNYDKLNVVYSFMPRITDNTAFDLGGDWDE